MNGYISVKEAAARWDVTERQVQKMCTAGMIDGVIHFGKSWAIPEDTQKPTRTAKSKPGPRPKNKNEQEAGRDGKSEH